MENVVISRHKMACLVAASIVAYGFAAQVQAATAKGPSLSTLVSFTGEDGERPNGGLIADAVGDLFGTTYFGGAHSGGANGLGTVFEIDKTQSGYANTPTTLVSFKGAHGEFPAGSLIADAAGNFFGTTVGGGTNNDGTVFEFIKTKSGYAHKPTILVSFTSADGANPYGDLIADAAGDLFGTTNQGGTNNKGTVFELAKNDSGYASTPTTLVSFTGTDGDYPYGSLITDAAGNLFGTTYGGGTANEGTVFEIAKTKTGYAKSPTTLVSFSNGFEVNPQGSLIMDAAGDLFGTTTYNGNGPDHGMIFEIVKTKNGYANTPTTLINFTGPNGEYPASSLIMDVAGNLFGTTQVGGPGGDGTVFKLAKTKKGYARAVTTIAAFNGSNGFEPVSFLIANAAGDLFGTTLRGGSDDDGTVFEITNSGYVTK